MDECKALWSAIKRLQEHYAGDEDTTTNYDLIVTRGSTPVSYVVRAEVTYASDGAKICVGFDIPGVAAGSRPCVELLSAVGDATAAVLHLGATCAGPGTAKDRDFLLVAALKAFAHLFPHVKHIRMQDDDSTGTVPSLILTGKTYYERLLGVHSESGRVRELIDNALAELEEAPDLDEFLDVLTADTATPFDRGGDDAAVMAEVFGEEHSTWKKYFMRLHDRMGSAFFQKYGPALGNTFGISSIDADWRVAMPDLPNNVGGAFVEYVLRDAITNEMTASSTLPIYNPDENIYDHDVGVWVSELAYDGPTKRLDNLGGTLLTSGSDGRTFISPRDSGRTYAVYCARDKDMYALDNSHVELDRPRRIPTQTLGTCYFHAIMNMLVNNYAFIDAFMAHLRQSIDSSPYANKRTDRLQSALSLSRSAVSREDIRAIRAVRNADVYMWARNVLLYHTLMKAIRARGQDQEVGSLVLEASSFIMMKKFDEQKSVFGGLFANSRNLYRVGHGGYPIQALTSILRASGLDVKVHSNHIYKDRERWSESLVARIPSSGVSLMAYTEYLNSPEYYRKYYDHDREPIHLIGQSSGLYLTGTHALSYVSTDHAYRVIDSNDRDDEVTGPKNMPYVYGGVKQHGYMYAFDMPEWPYAKEGGGDDHPVNEHVIEEAAILAADPEVLASCDGTTCSFPDELSDALSIVEAVLASEDSGLMGTVAP